MKTKLKKFLKFWVVIQVWMTVGGLIMNCYIKHETGDTIEDFEVYEGDDTTNFIIKAIDLIFWPLWIGISEIIGLFWKIRDKFFK